MIPYILLFIIILALSAKIKQQKWTIFDVLLLIILVCFSGFRHGIGTDYSLYQSIFESCKIGIADMATSRTGIGFSFLMTLFNEFLNLKWEFFVFFCSLVTVILFYIFFKKYSSKPGIAILCYIALGFYTSSFNGFRQQLGLSLVLAAYILFKDRKFISSAILSTIAFFIHSSLIFLIILMILLNIKKINIKISQTIIASAIFLVFYDFLFSNILSIFTQYSSYIEHDSSPGIGTFIMITAYLLITLLVITRYRKKIIEINPNNKVFISLFYIGIGLMLLQSKNWLFARLAVDFTIFLPILLSDFQTIDRKNKKISDLVCYGCLFIYYIVYISSFGGVVPYESIF